MYSLANQETPPKLSKVRENFNSQNALTAEKQPHLKTELTSFAQTIPDDICASSQINFVDGQIVDNAHFFCKL